MITDPSDLMPGKIFVERTSGQRFAPNYLSHESFYTGGDITMTLQSASFLDFGGRYSWNGTLDEFNEQFYIEGESSDGRPAMMELFL
jgi:hypothetical protein